MPSQLMARARRTIVPRDSHYAVLHNASRTLLDGQTIWADVVHDLKGLIAAGDDAGVFR